MKNFVRGLVRRFGFDFARWPASSKPALVAAQLERRAVKLVFDVGANTGQYARDLRTAGYSGEIVSFEPLSVAHERLVRATEGDSLWRAHPATALGREEGVAEMNISENLVSSSILPDTEELRRAAPSARYVGKETVKITRLDLAAAAYLKDNPISFLKVDAQGYEKEIIEGASGILDKIIGIQAELSVVPLYEGQPLLMEMLSFLDGLGFELHAIFQEFVDPSSMRVLQVDGVFFRGERRG
jgi:FkbM family methyltransferase